MKPVVFVIGASGKVGKATVTALSLSYAESVDIKAGVRNPEKASDLKSLAGVTVVEGEMGQKEKLKAIFKGVSVLFIVCPGAENRAPLSIVTAEAAKEAGVKHLLVVSETTVENMDTTFGKQFNEIETAVSNMGVPYTFFRLPFFFENFFVFLPTIKEESMFYGPVDPNMSLASVGVEDAGFAAAAILVCPEKHVGKTYTIVSDRHSYADVARAFTKALGREVKYVRIPYEDRKASFMKLGFAEWQARGVMELYKLIDAGSSVTDPKDIKDFSKLTGEKPTDLFTWVSSAASAFK